MNTCNLPVNNFNTASLQKQVQAKKFTCKPAPALALPMSCACGICSIHDFETHPRCELCQEFLCNGIRQDQPACSLCILQAIKKDKMKKNEKGQWVMPKSGKAVDTCICGEFLAPMTPCLFKMMGFYLKEGEKQESHKVIAWPLCAVQFFMRGEDIIYTFAKSFDGSHQIPPVDHRLWKTKHGLLQW